MKKTSRKKTFKGDTDHTRELLEILAGELPPIIARKDVERFLGGIVTRKTLANADARGQGPQDAFAVGRCVVYRRDALLEYLGRSFTVQRLQSIKPL